MDRAEPARPSAGRGFAAVAVALAGFAFSLTPIAERLDDQLLDAQWSTLRKFAPRAYVDDIIIVGVDEASAAAIVQPLGLWHEPLGAALERIASARPRAIGFDAALPDRSYDAFHPGLDRPLLVGLIAARRNGPLVAALTIDATTRAARPIHTPFLAALGDQGLGIGLFGRDADGVTRRFSIAIPTEDGAFPTLAGRLCRVLSKGCTDGLIDYALGAPFRYVPLRQVLETKDAAFLDNLLRDRIVFVGDVQRHGDRINVPVNLAGWESAGPTSPGVVVHAQSLRTALNGAPTEAARPLTVVLVAIAALLALMRNARLAWAAAAVVAAAGVALGILALRNGTYVGLSAPLATLFMAPLPAVVGSWWSRRRGNRLT